MKFSIVFDKSGDLLEFVTLDSTRAEILDYYVDNLTQTTSNSFQSIVDPAFIDGLISNLHNSITESNKFIKNITGKPVIECSTEEYINQSKLNQLHADWVNSQSHQFDIQEKKQSADVEVTEIANRLHEEFSDDIPVIDLGNILNKLGYTGVYSQINTNLHLVESAFNGIKFATKQWLEFKNIFPKTLINNDICNFRIPFNHLGRTLFNKYQFFDTDLKYNDENSFNELLGVVEVTLARNQTIPLSQEYIAWCKKHNREPSGNYLNIGNLTDLEQNLNDYRLVIYRNIRNSNNFSIKLNKG
jgi:hypothetical protein